MKSSPRRSMRWRESAGKRSLLWRLLVTTCLRQILIFHVGQPTSGIQVPSGGVDSGIIADEPAMTVRRGPHPDSPSGVMSLEDGGSVAERVQNSDEGGDKRQSVSLCLLLIVRNEEESLQAHLPLWRDVADCFVIGIDDRTTDGTTSRIHQVLGDHASRFVFFFTFQDFAQARNAVLRATAQNFPNTSHIIFADADWRPELKTVDKSELDFVHGFFPFVVWDHSGHTSRLLGWMARFDEHLKFKHRVHEVLDYSATAASTLPTKVVGWEMQVVESASNWNVNLHGHSRSSDRFLFDLNLLELDLEDDPTDLHTLFYLGITKFAYIESLMGKGTHEKTPELDAVVNSGMFYLDRAVDLHGDLRNSEYVWGAKRWLAYGYYYFLGDPEKAERAYEGCIEYDPVRVDCVIFLSRLYLETGNLNAAWDKAMMGLLHRPMTGHVLTYFYTFECFVPTQAAFVISTRISTPESHGDDSIEGLLTLGWYLVRHVRDQCNHGVMVDSPEDIDSLESLFEGAIARQGINVEEMKQAALLNDPESLLALLLGTWGTGAKASSTSSPATQTLPQQTSSTDQDITDMPDLVADDLPLLRSPFDRHPKDAREIQHKSASASRLTNPESLAEKPDMVVKHRIDPGADDSDHENDTSQPMAFTSHSCDRIVGEARARLDFERKAFPGALAATRLAQISTVTAKAAVEQHSQLLDAGEPFRALVFGGVRGPVDPIKMGLEHEELLQVVSLLLEQSSSPTRSEITYVSPDASVVEAARSMVSRCSEEFGNAGGGGGGGGVHLDFVHSSVEDFLLDTAEAPQQFDFVDIGGPLSSSMGGSSSSNNAALKPTEVRVDTLRLLGPKLASGACLKVWAFARNRSTSQVFRAAARDKAMQVAAAPTSGLTAEGMLGRVLRTHFGIGQSAPRLQKEAVATTPTDEGEMWMQQVLAGGERLSIPDIDEVLADGGFKLVLMLGKNEANREAGGDLLEQGLDRWEMADFADSLELVPTLVHQVLAVWRGNGSTSLE